LRAVTPEHLKEVLAVIEADQPVHIHVAEQIKEIRDCVAWSGRRPVEFLLDTFDCDDRWCAIHATHMTENETIRLAKSNVVAGLCPTTEANLGDGIYPAAAYLANGGVIAIGSDSQITVSPAEELRMLEYSQRLRDLTRNALAGSPGASTGRQLFESSLAGGARALAQPMGAIKVGCRADLAVIDDRHPSIVGRRGDAAIDSWIFSAGNACIRHVFAAGRHVIKDGRHADEDAIFDAFERATMRLMS
jgi:formimidoylglutamate deiminase